MIYQKTIQAVTPLVDKTIEHPKVRLQAMEDTPLSQLARCSRPLSADVKNGESSPYDIVAASQTKDHNGVSEHDVTMDEVVNVVSKTVMGNLNIARNTVNPIVERVVENVQIYVSEKHRRLKQPLTVVPDIYHDVWNNPLLRGICENYASSPAIAVMPINALPHLSEQELREIVKTGMSRLDGDIESLIENNGPQWLVDVYNATIRGTDHAGQLDTENALPSLEELLKRPLENRDALFVTHCLARKLSKEVPENTRINLDDYRDRIATIISQTGRAVCRVLDKRERTNKNNELVISYPSIDIDYISEDGGTILVNSEVYNRWLKEGGSPEILFGAFVTTREKGYKTLLEMAERFTKAWERQERVIATNVRFDQFNHTVEGLKKTLSREIYEIDEDDCVVERSVLQERLKTLMRGIRAKDTENLYRLARHAVCQIFFAHTDAERILEAVDEACKDNPEIEVREAALLATVDIVSDWVASMIVVEPAS